MQPPFPPQNRPPFAPPSMGGPFPPPGPNQPPFQPAPQQIPGPVPPGPRPFFAQAAPGQPSLANPVGMPPAGGGGAQLAGPSAIPPRPHLSANFIRPPTPFPVPQQPPQPGNLAQGHPGPGFPPGQIAAPTPRPPLGVRPPPPPSNPSTPDPFPAPPQQYPQGPFPANNNQLPPQSDPRVLNSAPLGPDATSSVPPMYNQPPPAGHGYPPPPLQNPQSYQQGVRPPPMGSTTPTGPQPPTTPHGVDSIDSLNSQMAAATIGNSAGLTQPPPGFQPVGMDGIYTSDAGSRRPKRVHNYPEQPPMQQQNQFQPQTQFQQQPGYPPQQGYQPPNQGYPPQPGFPGNQGMQNPNGALPPGYPPQNSLGYPQQPTSPMQPPAPISKDMPSSKPRSRIDPNQVPSPVVVQEADSELHGAKSWNTFNRGVVPPLASTDVRYIDTGVCSPRFIRSTLYNVPATEELLNSSALPLGLIINPLAKLGREEDPIPVVDLDELGPVRCHRCKAYMNPFMAFRDGGKRFTCNLCQFVNEVPAEYFSNLDMGGRRIDLEQRPELRFGSVEFVAPRDYMTRVPQPASYVFVLDVSLNAVVNGSLNLACNALKRALTLLPREHPMSPSPCRVAILTYDRTIHFYNIRPGGSQAQMMVVADIDDVFLPLENGLFNTFDEAQEGILGLLDQIPGMFRNTQIREVATGAAVQAGILALKDRGGRLIVLSSSLPNHGPGLLKPREEVGILGTDKERSLYVPQDQLFKKLATDCATTGVCVDFIFTGAGYQDVATVGVLPSMTGGDAYHFPNFNQARDGHRLESCLVDICSRDFGFDALLRVRCCNGLRLVDHYGNFYMKGTTDLELAGIDSAKALAVYFKHDGKLDPNVDAAFQCALLYTTAFGQRRIRVHNLIVPACTTLDHVFRSAEMDTILNFIAKHAVTQAVSISMKTVRDQFTERCVKVLAAYRKFCASSTAPGQLILPEALKLFPLYALCLLKSEAFSGAPSISSDIRVHAMRVLKCLSIPGSIRLFYPKLYPLVNLGESIGLPDPTGRISLPEPVRLGYDRLQADGIYLLDNGIFQVVWIGRNVNEDIVTNLFAVPSVEQLHIKPSVLPALDNSVSIKARGVVAGVVRGLYESEVAKGEIGITLIRQGDMHEHSLFRRYLMEDSSSSAVGDGANASENMSYVDFLCHVHRLIQQELA